MASLRWLWDYLLTFYWQNRDIRTYWGEPESYYVAKYDEKRRELLRQVFSREKQKRKR